MAQERFQDVFCSIVAFLLYNFALTTLSSRVAVNILNIVPVAGLLWAVVLTGKTFSFVQLFGGVSHSPPGSVESADAGR